MKTFSINGELETILEDLTDKFGYADIQETLRKGFIFLHLIKMMDEEGGSFLYQAPDGEILALDIFGSSEVEEHETKIQENVEPKNKATRKIIR